jgi:hypothetical protein
MFHFEDACLFDEVSLGKRSRQGCHNVNVIGNAVDVYEFGTEVTADRG